MWIYTSTPIRLHGVVFTFDKHVNKIEWTCSTHGNKWNAYEFLVGEPRHNMKIILK
jgi:hypothetical protein